MEWVRPVNHRYAKRKMNALVSHIQQFEAHRKQFFADIYQFVVVIAHIVYIQIPRTRDLAIFVTTGTGGALPLAQRGVIIILLGIMPRSN